MAVRLFSLRGVPDDEAEEVRALLTGSDIEFYETSAGNWGVSNPGIWLRDEEQLQHAKQLIEQYQAERTAQQREIYEQLKREGKQKTFFTLLTEDPLKVIAYVAIVCVIIYFSIKPFLTLER